MADGLNQLFLQLELKQDKLEKSFAKAQVTVRNRFGDMQNTSSKASKRIEADMDRAATRVLASFNRMAMSSAAALAGAFGVSQVAAYADKWSEAGNKIAAAGEALDKVAKRQSVLADLAIRSRSDFSSVVDLYTGLARSTQALGASRAQVMSVVETISKGFAVSGASASTAAGAIMQLNQAMSAGALRGDELNSVLEGAPVLARLIAKEFGVSTGQLKALGEQGALTADRVFSALLKGRSEIETEFAKTNATISQSFVNLETAIARYIGEGDKASGTSAKIAGAIGAMGNNIDTVAPIVVSLGAALAGLFVGGPFGAGIAGATTAVYLFSDALRPIAGDVATIGDYARAAFELVSSMSSEAAGALQTAFAGVADRITEALSGSGGNVATVLENLLVGVKALANAMIGAFSFAAQTITATWNTLGFAMAEAMITAVNTAIQAIEDGANAAVSAINAITGAVNSSLGTAIGQIGAVELPQLTNAFKGAGIEAGEAYGSAFAALTKDYIGGTLDDASGALADLRKRANEIGAEREKAAVGSGAALDDGDINAPLKPAQTKAAGGSGGKGGSKGGGRSGGGIAKASEYDQATKALNDEIAALGREQAALGKSAAEATKAETAFKLLDAAKASGVPITDELRAKVDQLAGAYAAAQTSLDGAKESQAMFAQLGSTFTDGLSSGLASAIVEGKSLNGVLKELAATLAKQALNAGFSKLIGSVVGVALGAPAAGGIFAEGGFTGPGSKFDPAGIVHRGEYVLDAATVNKIGVANLDRLRANVKGFADGGLVGRSTVAAMGAAGGAAAPVIHISAPITVAGSAGTEAQNTDLAKRMRRELESSMRGVVADELRKQSRVGNALNNQGR